MARDGADVRVERIPSIISDILLTNSSSRDVGHSSGHIFDNIVQSISRQNCSDMPPLLLTEEDRDKLQQDRENAMKCEEMVARRKQEQYFDLVDKVQNVLRRIEKKNSQKSNTSQSEETYNSTSTNSASDCNNNPSPKHPETYVENNNSFTAPKHVKKTNANLGELLNWENSSQPTGKRGNNDRYSLPANFETTYLSAGNGESNGGIAVGGHMQRPVSAYSDRNVVYGNQWWFGNGGGREPVTNYHMYSPHQRPLSVISDNHFVYGGSNGYPGSGPETLHHQQTSNQRPLSVMSVNQHLYGGSNGYHSGQRPEALHQPWNQEPPYTGYHQSYTNTSENIDKHIRQAEMPQRTTNSTLKTSHSDTFDHSSLIDNSPISQSGQNSISKQREFLALEQKRLEHHYTALQGQLLADFQKRQQDLIEVYNKNLETQSSIDHTMQSVLERSLEYDSEETLSTTDKENFTIVETEELPQSPFGINVKNNLNSFQNGEVKNNSRSIQNSAETRKQGYNSFLNSGLPNGKAKNTVRFNSSDNSLQNSTSPNDARFLKNSSTSQNYVSPDRSFPKTSSVPRNSVTQDQRFKNTSRYLVQSFNSEASAQEYYEMPRFGEKTEKTEVVGNKSRGDLGRGSSKNGVVGKPDRNSKKNFGASVVTSPKRTQLNSFESQAIKNLKNTQSHKFFVVSAYAKGFLTRLLFQTAKIHGLITTVKDARSVLAEMNTESSQSITDRSFKERVKAQLHSAQSELRRIFVDSSPHVRMQILEQNRKLLQEKQARDANKVYSAGGTVHNRPKLSNVTMKKRLSRHANQELTPKSEKACTPSSSKVSRGSAKQRNTPKGLTKNTPAPSVISAQTTPKSKAKNEVSSVSDTTASDTTKTAYPVAVTGQTTRTTSATLVTTSTTTKTTAVTTSPVTTTGSRKMGAKKHDATKTAKNRPSVKSSKTTAKVTQTSMNKRRTWDVSVLKPIQGRISPTIPTEKARLSNDKRQSTLSTARKVGQKILSEYKANDVTGQSNTCEVSGIDMSKTYKVNNKPEQPIKKPGAKRSLAANLSHK